MRTTRTPDGRTGHDVQAVAARVRAMRPRTTVIIQGELAVPLPVTRSEVASEAGQRWRSMSVMRRLVEAMGCDADLVIPERKTA